jgi:hypothetical protein
VVVVTGTERDLLSRFVHFLNLTIETKEQVEKLFRDAYLVADPGDAWSGVSVEDYQRDQGVWRGRLEPLAQAFGNERKIRAAARALVPVIRRDLSDKPVATYVSVDRHGRREDRYKLDGVLQACAMAARFLVDRDVGLRGRFGLCTSPAHGKRPAFVLTFAGKPRKYCNNEHTDDVRRSGGAARQRAYRKRLEVAERARAERAAQKARE